MNVQLAVAKIEKYAVGESGDTVEIVERPHGGVSAVLVDGQRSGKSAKVISNLVVRKAIALLAEGVRDGAAARAAHDYLRTQRSGRVSAELVMLSADLETGTLVISRNSRAPVLVYQNSGWRVVDTPAEAVGIHARTRPQIEEIPLRPGTVAIAMSDGIWSAGTRCGALLDVVAAVQDLPVTLSARAFADDLLARALAAEEGRPGDDLTVVTMRVDGLEHDNVRRLQMSLPIPPVVCGAWAEIP